MHTSEDQLGSSKSLFLGLGILGLAISGFTISKNRKNSISKGLLYFILEEGIMAEFG